EALDELTVLGQVGEDLLDDAELLEALRALHAGQEDLSHPAGGDGRHERVPAEGDRLERAQSSGLVLDGHHRGRTGALNPNWGRGTTCSTPGEAGPGPTSVPVRSWRRR